MANSNGEKLVLVTGGTGFVGVHRILQLLNAGYRVRTTLRSLARKMKFLKPSKMAARKGWKILHLLRQTWQKIPIGTKP
jgi:nucleoside-diphosphate-sugar epimerase